MEDVLGSSWAHFPPLDPDEEEQRRLRQKMYLSRYGSEPSHSWDNRLVWELDDAYAEMGRIIRLENGNE